MMPLVLPQFGASFTAVNYSPIMLPELSITLLEKFYNTGVTHDDRRMMVIICL